MYSPNDYDLFMFFILICKKHNIPYVIPETLKGNMYLEDLFVRWHCFGTHLPFYRRLEFPLYLKNNQAPIFAVPLIMRHRDCKNAQREDKHACMLVYVRNEKALYFYDPTYNNSDYDIKKLYNELVIKFTLMGHLVTEVKIPKTMCLQGKQECEIARSDRILGDTIGFCSIWSIHFLDHFFTGEKTIRTSSLTVYIKDYLESLIKMRREFENKLPKKDYEAFYLIKKRQMGNPDKSVNNWAEITMKMLETFRLGSY